MNRYKEAKAWIDRMNAHPEFAVIEITEPALSQVTRLLERATPKKAELIEDWYSCCYECPNCGISIWCDGDEKEHKYCFNCGQALDWENEVQEDDGN